MTLFRKEQKTAAEIKREQREAFKSAVQFFAQELKLDARDITKAYKGRNANLTTLFLEAGRTKKQSETLAKPATAAIIGGGLLFWPSLVITIPLAGVVACAETAKLKKIAKEIKGEVAKFKAGPSRS